MVSSLILRPNDVAGIAFNQAPDSLVEEASRQALVCGLLALEIKESNLCCTLGWSQAFCWWVLAGDGGEVSLGRFSFQDKKADLRSLYVVARR